MVLRTSCESIVFPKRTFYSSGPEKDPLEVGSDNCWRLGWLSSLLLLGCWRRSSVLMWVTWCKQMRPIHLLVGLHLDKLIHDLLLKW